MLSAAARLRRGQDFDLVFRRGVRCGRPRLVVHALVCPAPIGADGRCADVRTSQYVDQFPTRVSQDSGPPFAGQARSSGPRVGFVVSKAVGGSVVRHRVTRRLRHLMRDRLTALGPADIVVRALPAAASATSVELSRDLDSALRRLRLTADARPRDGANDRETS